MGEHLMVTPSVGSRVSLRYRLPAGSEKLFTDVVGHVEALTPRVAVRTKSGDVVEVSSEDIVSVRELSHTPVRTSEIRAVEHAAALAWPGTEHQWQDGWLLRAADGFTRRGNSAVPLDFSATLEPLPMIADWYAQRGLPAWLAIPERVLSVRAAGVKQTRVMVRDVSATASAGTTLSAIPDAAWLATYRREVPAEVLTAVVDGEVIFATVTGAAVGRGAVTTAPDGPHWLGISSVRVAAEKRGQGHARAVCEALLAWGFEHRAERAYVEVLTDNASAIALYESMGFRLHHNHRYVMAESLLPPRL